MVKKYNKPDLSNKLSKKKQVHILIAVAIGTFMTPLDSSVVNIALPNISNYFNVDLTRVEWVIISYLLIISSLLLTYGRVGDLFGHKRTYNLGFIIFTIGSILCAFSPTFIYLILFRAIQAIGAGMLMAMGPAIITISAPHNQRGKYLGIIAISVSVALAIGPVLGGFLTNFFGWQSIFLINIPIGIFGFIYAKKVIPFTKSDEKTYFDFIGSIVLFIALACIVFSLSFADKLGFSNLLIIIPLILGFILIFVFIIIENKREFPMMDMRLFKNRIFTMGNISLLINFMAQYTVILIMPFYLQQLLDLSPFISGLLLISFPSLVMIVAPISGTISDKIDARYISSAGMAITTIGLFLLSTLEKNSSYIKIIGYLSIIGLGSGTFLTPNNSAIMGSVSPNRRGIASSMIATMRNLGMVLGVALSGFIFTNRKEYLISVLSNTNLNPVQIQKTAFEGSLNFTFLIAAGIAFIAIFTSLIRGPLNSKSK